MNEDTPDLDPDIEAILEKFPFLSYGTLKDKPYLGIILNCDNKILSMYVLDLIPDEGMRKLLLSFGEEWWWDSNRQVPINMFIKDPRFRAFRTCLRHFSRKDFNVVAGHIVSLADAMARRVRKRQISLIRRL